jgi:hypothetical protein
MRYPFDTTSLKEHARCDVIRDGRKGLITVCFVWCFLNDCCIQHEGNVPLLRPRRRWEDNIKMDLQEVECGGHGLDPAGSG